MKGWTSGLMGGTFWRGRVVRSEQNRYSHGLVPTAHKTNTHILTHYQYAGINTPT